MPHNCSPRGLLATPRRDSAVHICLRRPAHRPGEDGLTLARDRDWEPFDRWIDIRIARIRCKIGSDPARPQVIETVRGAGYIFSGGEG